MAEKTLAEMTESELRQVINEELKQQPRRTPPLRARLKIGEIELEFEGNPRVVSDNLNKLLSALSNRQRFVPDTSGEKYDFEKDKTVTIMPGPPDFGERAEEILAQDITDYGWTLKRERE